MNTEVGRIATLLKGKNENEGKNLLQRLWGNSNAVRRKTLGLEGTPLQIKLSKFALLLFALAIFLAIIVFSVNKVCIDTVPVIWIPSLTHCS